MKVFIFLTVFAVAVFAATKRCGDETFDNTLLMCCNGAITDRPDPDCVPAVNQRCCNEEAFDSRTYQCCGGTINPRPDGYRINNKCCNTTAFDNLANICCGGTVSPRPEPTMGNLDDIRCCDEEPFDRVRCRCDSGEVICV